MALAVPSCMSYAATLVSTPVLPPIVPPPCSNTDATVSLRVPIASCAVAPLTVTALALAITLSAPSASVPAVTDVAPV